MLKTIMVPLDGFSLGESALPQACGLARRAGGRIHITHVLEMLMRPPYADRVSSQQWWNGAATELAEEYLRAHADRLRSEGITVTHSVLNGIPAEALLAEGARIQPDLVMMTTHGRGPLRRLWLGSVADQVARESALPVLLLPPIALRTRARAFSHVLVTLDGSPVAEEILEPALDLARTADAKITLLHVTHPNGVLRPLDYLELVRESIRDAGVEVRTETVISNAWVLREINRYARRHAVDLIALATRRHRLLYNLLGGSVTDRAVRFTQRPVLLYTPHGKMEGRVLSSLMDSAAD